MLMKEDEELLSGYLNVTIHSGRGFLSACSKLWHFVIVNANMIRRGWRFNVEQWCSCLRSTFLKAVTTVCAFVFKKGV